MLIDISLVLKITGNSYFKDIFSLIGIILFPRVLSIFNNYVFFNLIVLSFNKMIFNLIGLIFFFFTLISGFYFSFVTLSENQTNGEILFNMIKIFLVLLLQFGIIGIIIICWEKLCKWDICFK